MQHLLFVALFVTYVSSAFLHAERTRAHAKLFDTTTTSTTTSTSTTSILGGTGLPGSLFSYFNLEGAGAYSILGYNSAKITYPPVIPGPGLVSSAAFAIDPARKMVVFNQGESGNQYVFANGTYITLNISTNPSVPLLCTYLPYVNYDQEVLAINNITLQDVYWQPTTPGGALLGIGVFEQVKLYSGIMVDASSCGTMIQFSATTTRNGHIRGVYAAEPFNVPAYGSPTGAVVASSTLIFDDTTIVSPPSPSFFQLPSSCFTPNIVNYCAATGYGAPPTPVCNLFPAIH